MAYTLERLPNEPILIVTYIGHVTPDEVIEMYQRSLAFIADMGGQHVYRITQTQGLESSFAEVMEVLQKTRQNTTGSSLDPNITVILVGSNAWLKLFREGMRQNQFGQVNIPFYETLEDALRHVRFLIQTRQVNPTLPD